MTHSISRHMKTWLNMSKCHTLVSKSKGTHRIDYSVTPLDEDVEMVAENQPVWFNISSL